MPLVEWLDARKLDADALLRQAGITRKELSDPELRIARELVGDVWRAAVVATGDAALGLRVAKEMRPGTLGLIEYAARNGASLGDALLTLTRFSALLAEGIDFALRSENGRATLEYRVSGSPQPPAVMDFVLGYLARLAREFTRPPVQPLEACFDHAPPADRAPYEALFGSRLRFDAGRNALAFDASLLDAQVQAADPQLHAVLSHQAERLLAALPKGDDFLDRVRRLITTELRDGQATAQSLAKKLHMSARTFQRRLLDAGTTHSQLLDEVRHSLALRLLEQQELTLSEIAAALGFNDVSAFRKAFKRWTGESPKKKGQ